MATGHIASFDDDEGTGVIESDETPGGCWFHYSQWPHQEVAVGQAVSFEWDAIPQDGYSCACRGDVRPR